MSGVSDTGGRGDDNGTHGGMLGAGDVPGVGSVRRMMGIGWGGVAMAVVGTRMVVGRDNSGSELRMVIVGVCDENGN